MPTNPPLGFDSNEYTSEGEFYRSNSPEQLRLDEKRNYAFGGGLLKGITELPLELLEMMSPADEYVPGALAPDQSSPRQRLRTERLHGEQFYDELKADPDTAQAAEVGYGTSFVGDPIIDTGIGLAPHLVKGFKAISKGERAAPKLANLFSDEVGAIGDIAGTPVDLSKQSLSEVFSEARAGRMERATEQGFDIDEPLYHGSGDISDFSSFDPAMTGKGNDQYGSGFYLTTSPHEASGYASDVARGQGKFKTKNPGVIPVYSNMKNYIDVDPKTQNNLGDVIDLDASQVRKMLDKSDALKRGVDDEDMNPAGDHFESFWNDGPEDWMLDDLAETYAHGTPESIEVDLFDGDSDAFRRALGEVTGMEGLRVNHGDGLSHVIPWFPENIRSVNAQFDPAKTKSGELLATAAGASVALSAANSGEPVPVDMSKTTLREVLAK